MRGNDRRCIYRILTHHGRTDDLDSAKTQIGQKETRYLQSLADAELLYDHVMAQKMADEKGYKHVDLVSVSPKIGSDKVCRRTRHDTRHNSTHALTRHAHDTTRTRHAW
jgi:hypothetical protein